MKKNKQHPLDDDISPVMRCGECHQPFSFGRCGCKNNKQSKEELALIKARHEMNNAWRKLEQAITNYNFYVGKKLIKLNKDGKEKRKTSTVKRLKG